MFNAIEIPLQVEGGGGSSAVYFYLPQVQTGTYTLLPVSHWVLVIHCNSAEKWEDGEEPYWEPSRVAFEAAYSLGAPLTFSILYFSKTQYDVL